METSSRNRKEMTDNSVELPIAQAVRNWCNKRVSTSGIALPQSVGRGLSDSGQAWPERCTERDIDTPVLHDYGGFWGV